MTMQKSEVLQHTLLTTKVEVQKLFEMKGGSKQFTGVGFGESID